MRKKPPPDKDALIAAWATKTRAQICEEFGFGDTSLSLWAKRYCLGPKPPPPGYVDPKVFIAASASRSRVAACKVLGCSSRTFSRHAKKLGVRPEPPGPDRVALSEAWATQTIQAICESLKISRRSLYRWAKKYSLGPKPWGTHGARTGCRRPDATEEEIREYTLSLQATWSEAKRERRAGKSRLVVAAKAMGYDGRSARFTEKPL